MEYSEVVAGLRSGELSAHGMFLDNPSGDMERLLLAINQTLTDLYTRFPLAQREVTIIQRSYITHYVLLPKYAYMHEPRDPHWYIWDSEHSLFTGDVLKIVGVTDENGDRLHLNSNEYCKVANTATPNTVEIPNPTEGNAVFVMYNSNHPVVDYTNTTIWLPVNFMPALYAGVAAKIYSGGTSQEHISKTAECMQKFEMFCVQQREYGMTNEQVSSEFVTKFCLGGWV